VLYTGNCAGLLGATATHRFVPGQEQRSHLTTLAPASNDVKRPFSHLPLCLDPRNRFSPSQDDTE